MFPPDFKITTDMLWQGAALFAILDAVLIPILAWRIGRAAFYRLKWTLVLTTAAFWAGMWSYVLANYWDSVYRYVFPSWARGWLPGVYGAAYAGVSLLFWWLALRMHGSAAANYCLLGGTVGMVTHLLAVRLGIVDKPPVLQGAAPAAAVVIAIFEFTFYAGSILGSAAALQVIWRKAGPKA